MKAIRRRKFFKESSTALACMSLGAWHAGFTLTAAGQSPSKFSNSIEKVLADLETTQARYYNVPRVDGEFLHLLIKATRARSVLEIGTANGYSAIWLCLALEETNGKLTTIEISPELVRAAKENLKKVELAQRVNFLEGDAHQVVTQIQGPFDVVFIDAELGGKMDYFRKLYPAKLVPGGLIVVHNAIHYKSAMQDYLDFIKGHRDFDTVILSLTMQDGFALSYRQRAPSARAE